MIRAEPVKAENRIPLITRTICIASLAAVFFCIPTETRRPVVGSFDCQIVLGGNMVERSMISYELWTLHQTPIIVTGDQGQVMKRLVLLGIENPIVYEETEARSTWENAKFSIPILRTLGAKRAVIVTSDFHSARALSCFEEIAPDIEFLLQTTPAESRTLGESLRAITHEKVKRLFYALQYGIWPWR